MTEVNQEANNGAVSGAATHEMNGEAGELPFANVEADVTTAPTTDVAAAITIPSASNGSGSTQESPVGVASMKAVMTKLRLTPTQGDVKRPPPQDLNGAIVQAPEAWRVADIKKDKPDCRGQNIDFIFFVHRDYAIYLSGGKIMVQYADDDAVAKDQRISIADLLPLRDRLSDLVSNVAPVPQRRYHWQIAEFLRQGLDGQKDAAKLAMQAAIDDFLRKVNAIRVRDGRIVYLKCAVTLVIAAVVPLCAIAGAMYWFHYSPEKLAPGLGYLMLATGSGAIGALLSTAMALRERTVALDGDLKMNAVDSFVRIMIGVISGAVCYLILDSNLLAGVVSFGSMSFGTQDIPREAIWKFALLAGFIGGFTERLVPDLLEKKLAPATK